MAPEGSYATFARMSPSTRQPRSSEEVQRAWSDPRSGAHYRGARWSGDRRRGRDARRLRKLLERHGAARALQRAWLDVACGTGRLAEFWSADSSGYVGVDASPSMLLEHPLSHRVLRASAFELPFPDDAFELVVACRFLHHLVEERDLIRAAKELARVSSSLVLVSYWDSASLSDWRRPKRGFTKGDPRIARPRAELARAFEQAGGEILGSAYSMRFVSRQAYCLVRVT